MSLTELPGTMLAPAKLNLCLYVGPKREDGLHEIRSLFEPLELADELKLTEAPKDEVIIEGIEGPDLTAGTLRSARARLGRPAAADRGRPSGCPSRRGSAEVARTPPRSCASRAAGWRVCARSPPGSGRTFPRSSSPAPAWWPGRER